VHLPWAHPQFGANLDRGFISREAAKNAKEEDFDGCSSLRLRKILW
jgi:hypothetical protein